MTTPQPAESAPSGETASEAACAACDGSCGVCPYVRTPHIGEVCWRGECRNGCAYLPHCSETRPDDPTDCGHGDVLDRPESDTWECLECGHEGTGTSPLDTPASSVGGALTDDVVEAAAYLRRLLMGGGLGGTAREDQEVGIVLAALDRLAARAQPSPPPPSAVTALAEVERRIADEGADGFTRSRALDIVADVRALAQVEDQPSEGERVCPECEGYGNDEPEIGVVVACPRCGGTGRLPAQPSEAAGTSEGAAGCSGCWTCQSEQMAASGSFSARMMVCPDCGNKRCPKANHHDSACTGSNEPGQPGSAYPS